jgi:hypothetical protein
VTSSPDSHNADVQARLWTVSEELTGVRFPAQSTVTETTGPDLPSVCGAVMLVHRGGGDY